MTSGAERLAQLEARVQEHLEPGETLRAAIWVSRADGKTDLALNRRDMSPWRFRKRVPDGPGARRGVDGAPRSLAVGLDEHIRTVTEPRVLALTDRRLLVLAKRSGGLGVFRPSSGPVPPLRLRWEAPRAELTTAVEKSGRLRLTFTDRSGVTLLTPIADVRPFLADLD